ncbi:MAG: alpha-amylase/4-alpha-glucanotransferase domain-containing protein [Thermodesulfobacteriota bacterium]
MINFVFCIHNHQPVGNFDHVLKDACEKSYLPFLNTLSKYPSIKVSLHTSGFLLDWMQKNRKEYIDTLAALVDRGQVELLGGGYYEPILSLIPERDCIGQITMMTERLEALFGYRPSGIWLAERVWEPHLPQSLAKAGVEYTVLDDYHFIKSGLHEEDLTGYYLTEKEDYTLKVFPGSEKLRYLIPFEPVESVLEHLKRVEKNNHSPLIVYADDGEKFGMWPGTYSHVYEKGWLDSFFSALHENRGWLRCTHFTDFIKEREPAGRVYLHTASYKEMEEWALPIEAASSFSSLMEDINNGPGGEKIRRFLRGGFWKNFLVKYPEAHWMYKRMLSVSRQLEGQEDNKGSLDHLYRSQCNDAYWHGVFGGLYLPHLRSAVYENIIKAENLLDNVGKEVSGNRVKIEEADFDSDTHTEVRVTTPAQSLFISPRSGGNIFEWDYRPKPYNLLNILSRYREGYHEKVREQGDECNGQEAKSIHDAVLTKGNDLHELLIYDDYRRGFLQERFLDSGITPELFRRGEFEEKGDFVQRKYTLEVKPPCTIHLSREGSAFGRLVQVDKEIIISDSDASFIVRYSVKNLGENRLCGLFGTEGNLLLGFGEKEIQKDHGTTDGLSLREDWLGLEVNFCLIPAARVFTFPIETISLSESGVEKNLQGTSLFPHWELDIKSGGYFEASIEVSISKV